MLVSPSSIIWYWPKGSDPVWSGIVLAVQLKISNVRTYKLNDIRKEWLWRACLTLRYDITIQYNDTPLFFCSEKLTGSQLSLPHVTKQLKITNTRTKRKTDKHRKFRSDKLWFPAYQISWVSDWVSDFSLRVSSAGGRDSNEIWHKCSLGGEDDTRTSNVRITQLHRESAWYHTQWKIQLASHRSS